MNKKFIKKLVIGLTMILTLGVPMTAVAAPKGEYPSGQILSFGADLSDSQEAELRKYFKAPDDLEAIYVDNNVAIKQFGLDPSEMKNFTGGWYSSAYVQLKAEEFGVRVKSNNLTLVTNDMLANALITSGILNADVLASAPFEVTGESALAGILAGAEKIMGGELKTENKQAAQEEIGVSLDLAEEIGQTEAAALINDIKTEVIKEKPETEKEVADIVQDVASKYDVNISEGMKTKMVSLMSDINDLDIDYAQVKDTLEKAASNFKDELAAIGKELKESGILDKIWAWFKDLINSIFNN